MSTPLSPSRWYHVGPHAYYDLVRMARRGRTTVARVLYVLALFAALAIVHYNTPSPAALGLGTADSINHNARIAERFSKTILAAQYFAVLILMPIYCVAGIQDERDRQTLALLFTTQLSASGILTGKLISRGVHVAGVVAAGLPILAFVQLWGGIDMPMIAVNFWNTAMLIASVGALSLLVASRVHKLTAALTLTYLVELAALAWMTCCCAPIASFNRDTLFLLTPSGAMRDGYAEMLNVAGLLTLGHVIFTAFCLVRAAKVLRKLRDERPTPLDPFRMMGVERPIVTEAAEDMRLAEFPPITEPALAWKECYADRHCLFAASLLMLPVYCGLMFAVFLFSMQRSAHGGSVQLIVYIMLVTFAWYVLSIAGRLAASIVVERQRQTLDALLTLPIDRRTILRLKVRGNLERSWHMLAMSGVAWVGVLVLDYPQMLAMIGFTLALLAQAAFCGMLGLYLSVVCRTAMAAYVLLGVSMMALLLGLPISWLLVATSENSHRLFMALDPALAWLTMSAKQREWSLIGDTILGAAVYSAAAAALWAVACRDFQRNPCRT